MSLDDTVKAMKSLFVGKDSMSSLLENSNLFKEKNIEKALDGISTKGGIANAVLSGLKNGVSGFGSALTGFIASPAFKVIATIVAITAAIKLLSEAIVTPKEAIETMNESFGEFETAKSELESLNSELQTTKDSIADLQAKGNLSFVEKKDLKNLKEQQTLLEMQQDIAEKNVLGKARTSAQSAAEAYYKNFRKEISDEATAEYQERYADIGIGVGAIQGDDSNVSSLIASIKVIKDFQENTTDPEIWASYQEAIDDTTASIWEQADALADQKVKLLESKSAIEENGGFLTQYQQTALDNITSSLDYIYKEMSPETWAQMKVDDLFGKSEFSDVKQELTDIAKTYGNIEAAENAISNSGMFSEFLKQLSDATDGTVALFDLLSNIFSEVGIIDVNSVRFQLKNALGILTEYSPGNAQRFNDESDTRNWIDSLSSDDLKVVYRIMLETDTANYSLEQWKSALENAKETEAISFELDIASEQEGISKVTSAIEESRSETGLLSETIEILKNRYKALDDFNASKLFTETANGIQLNAKYLNELETAYVTQNLDELNNSLEVAKKRYQEAYAFQQAAIDSGVEEIASYKARVKSREDDVRSIERQIAQYKALNGAYAAAVAASSSSNAGAKYDNTKTLYDAAVELRNAGKVNTDDFKSFVDLMKGSVEGERSLSEYVKEFDSLNNKIRVLNENGESLTISQSINSFFSKGRVGAQNFVTALKTAGDFLGEGWVTFENGNYELNVDTSSISKALGISEELAQILLENLSQYWDIDTEPACNSTDELKAEVDNTASELENVLNGIDIKPIEIDLTGKNGKSIAEQITEVEQWIKDLEAKNLDSEVLSTAREHGNNQLRLLYTEQQEQSNERFDLSSVEKGSKNVAARWNAAKSALVDYTAAVSTYGQESEQAQSAQTNFSKSISELTSILQSSGIETITVSPDLSIDLNANDAQTQLQNAFSGLQVNSIDISAITPASSVNAGGTITYENVVTPLTAEQTTATGTIYWNNVTSSPNGGHVVGGTFAKGTAYAQGNWGTTKDGVALGGELGRELVVRDGQFFTIGDKSAEFFRYKKNDIIFNANQTQQILKEGKITKGKKRGKAFANGTTGGVFGRAFSTGWNGSGKWWNSGSSSDSSNGSDISATQKNNNKPTAYKKNSGKEFYDWIEVLIDRIERAITHFEGEVNNVFSSWEKRSNALNKQSDLIQGEISKQKEAYDYYMKYAESIDLDEKYKEKVRDGTIEISEYSSDTDLLNAIEAYRDFYEKALDCSDAVDKLNVSLSECYQTAFDNVVTHYDQLISSIEHNRNLLDESIAQSEARGYMVSGQYYSAQIQAEQDIIDKTIQKRNELIDARDKALNDGAMVEGSEAYMEMSSEINSCTEAIEKSKTSIIELNNSIRDVEWGMFDLLQDKISNVSSEADFLIDLFESGKLYDSKGQLTDDGLAALGLHGQNYNVYMHQADLYAKELEKLNGQIANDPMNQDLIDRRQELLEAQQDNILAAESEKQAIIDLVQDGIDTELDSLQELIDKYKEKLNVQKDMYDYNKELSEQTKEIATLEKQLAAYQGNESEEIKSKVQQIKVSLDEAKSNLEESQYDRFITEQEKMLDELYDEYEEILNARLDDVTKLIDEAISSINSNSAEIGEIITKKADSVGYITSESLSSIWIGESGIRDVVTEYGRDFLSKTTSTNNILSAINSNIISMVSQLNALANTDIGGVSSLDEYASGARKISKDDIAWTQEDGNQEYIIRPSDGAILTKVAQDDSILSAWASDNIWNMANDPTEFIKNNLNQAVVTPTTHNSNQAIVQNFDKVVFNMPNVHNYSEMLREMQHDNKFEKLVNAITIDRLAGKSRLGIGKSF